jgi:hypothetical protein
MIGSGDFAQPPQASVAVREIDEDGGKKQDDDSGDDHGSLWA